MKGQAVASFVWQLLLAMVFASLAGCASRSTQQQVERAHLANFELQMYTHDQSGSEAIYAVDRSGMLSFGGGLEARLNRFTWSGPLTADELSELKRLVHASGWLDRKAQASSSDSQHYRISIKADGRQRSFRLKGEEPNAKAVRLLLEQASRRRLDSDLQRLPQPGEQLRPGA